MWKFTCICIIYNFIIYLFIYLFFSDEKIQGTVSLISVSPVSFVSSPEQGFFCDFYNTVEKFHI